MASCWRGGNDGWLRGEVVAEAPDSLGTAAVGLLLGGEPDGDPGSRREPALRAR